MENSADAVASLRASLDGYRMLLTEANDRVTSMRGESAVLDARAKALQAELDALKAEPPKPAEPPASE